MRRWVNAYEGKENISIHLTHYAQLKSLHSKSQLILFYFTEMLKVIRDNTIFFFFFAFHFHSLYDNTEYRYVTKWKFSDTFSLSQNEQKGRSFSPTETVKSFRFSSLRGRATGIKRKKKEAAAFNEWLKFQAKQENFSHKGSKTENLQSANQNSFYQVKYVNPVKAISLLE